MKTCFLAATILLLAITGCATSDRAPNPTTAAAQIKDPSLIDPDAGIYGIPYGTSEQEFIASHGRPMGQLKLNRNGSALIYNNTHAFIFDHGKLAGLRISLGMFDAKLTYGRFDEGKFDRISWKLSDGIENGMLLADVRKILGDRLSMRGELQHYYLTAKSRVNLDFTSVRDAEGNSAYKVCGVHVEHGAREPADKIKSVVSFAGIGATVDRDANTQLLTILSVSPYGPADEAQLKPGTPIYNIDGLPTAGLSVASAADLLRGEPGSTVELLVPDFITGKPRRVTLVRRAIKF